MGYIIFVQRPETMAMLPAGKTTLINHILSQNHGRKVAVIENEFGEVGIDHDLIVGKEDLKGDELTILENGCLCCTVRDDLVKALAALVERGGLDHVLIETTGTSFCLPWSGSPMRCSDLQLAASLTYVWPSYLAKSARVGIWPDNLSKQGA